jgi:hypothetical protein
MGRVWNNYGINALYQLDFLFDVTMGRILSTQVPDALGQFVYSNDAALFHFWFEPFVLRLNLPRGLIWIGLRSIPFHVSPRSWDHYSVAMTLGYLSSSALSIIVLRGWRSRPWVMLIAGILLASVDFCLLEFPTQLGYWFDNAVLSLPYATILLYGTRLLCQEERVHRKISNSNCTTT